MLFLFNDTATTEIYTLSLHDALPIWPPPARLRRLGPEHHLRGHGVDSPDAGSDLTERCRVPGAGCWGTAPGVILIDRKSTRLNSSHANISYAVFCLKKKKLSHLVTDT